jgi:hypothetical protein
LPDSRPEGSCGRTASYRTWAGRWGLLLFAAMAQVPSLTLDLMCFTGLAWGGEGMALWFSLADMTSLTAVGLLVIAVLWQVLCLAARRVRPSDAVVRIVLMSWAITVCFGTARFGKWMRKEGFVRVAAQAQVVVDAVHDYVASHGRPPSRLSDVRDSIPEAVWSRVPSLHLLSEDISKRRFGGEDWVLVADVSTGILNWDLFYYAPSESYPRSIQGGWVERIGRWAYVHE